MDNSNNPNDPNSPNNPLAPSSPWGTPNPLSATDPVSTIPDPINSTPVATSPISSETPSNYSTPPSPASAPWNSNPYPAPTSTLPTSDLNQTTPHANPFLQSTQQPWSPPPANLDTNPVTTTNSTPQAAFSSPWSPPPVTPSPTTPDPSTYPASPISTQPAWPETATQPNPVPDLSSTSPTIISSTMPADHPALSETLQTTPEPQESVQSNTASPSPLDNPWGTPPSAPQTPPMNAAEVSNPLPAENPIPTAQTPVFSPPSSSDASAPTDLSHLITGNSTNHDENMIQNNSSETLVVPSTVTPDIPTVPEEHKGIPKWLIGIGIGMLILVAGASAYFILGIGKAPEAPTSAPAQITQETPPPAAVTTPIPAPQESPTATGSANFGQLEGGTTSTSQQQATSAADLIRQRQQR